MDHDAGSGPQETTPEAERTFAGWLNAIAEHAGVPQAAALKALLSEHGCVCTRPALETWLSGAGTPPAEKMRQVIGALNKALPKIDVWDDYRGYIEGRDGDRRSTVLEAPTLDELLDRSGLPPGLM